MPDEQPRERVRVGEWLPAWAGIGALGGWTVQHAVLGITHWLDWLVVAVIIMALAGHLGFMRRLAYARGQVDVITGLKAINGRLIMCGACGERFRVDEEEQVLPAITLHAERDCRGMR